MEIELGNIAHIDELEALYNDLNDYLSSTVNYSGWIKGIYPVRETATEAIEENTLFVLKEDDGTIVGSIILNHKPENGYDQVQWGIEADNKDILVVHTLVVHPSYMKKNIGTVLMEFAKHYATTMQIKTIRLDVSEKNLPAIALYEKQGYRYVGTVDLGLPYEHLKWFKLYELIL